MRSSTFRALTGAALTAGLLSATAGTAAADSDHAVESGDTLAGIAAQHEGVSWRDLLDANADEISDPSVIIPGQVLTVPDDTEDVHEVVSGETLAEIAGLYDHVASWQALAEANADMISDPDVLVPGQQLRLSGAASEPTPAPQSEPAEQSSQQQAQPQEESTPSEPDPAPAQSTATDAGVWDRLAECESNGNWSANTGNGFYGGLQFEPSSWEWVGGSGMPHEASKQEQINRAEILLDRQGWSAWPACSEQLGLR